MKKILVLIVATLWLYIPSQIKAQDVLKYLMKTNTAVCNDSTKDINTRKIAVFKVDELTYLQTQAFPATSILNQEADSVRLKTINSAVKLLNEQSLAMNTYVNLFLKRLGDCKKRNRDKVSYIFKHATLDNSMWHDMDKDLVMSYYDRSDYPIQFCLDCDWEKALEFIRTIDWSQYE